MEARITVLEEIAKSTKDALGDIRADVRELRTEISGGMRGLRTTHDRDFRIVFGAMIAAALGLAWLMAHGFHWI